MDQKSILYVCNGCCCGHEEKGYPLVKNDLFTELLEKEGLQNDVIMEKPYCLGPCRMANVVKIVKNGRTYWFRKINTEEDVHAVIDFVKNPTEVPSQIQLKQVFF